MKIIGYNLTKISVERQEKQDDKIQVKQNINIDDVSKDEIPITKDEVLKIQFTFNVDYNEGKFAKLEFKGHIILIPEKEELKQVMKSWKDKQIPEQFRIPLFNFIMNKCNIKALNLEDEMALPLHIPMPRITPKQD